MSIEANPVPRVEPTPPYARPHLRRDGDEVLRDHELARGLDAAAHRRDEVVGGGVLIAQHRHHLRRRLARVDLLRRGDERVVVLLEVGLAPGEQVGERQLDHLLVLELVEEQRLAQHVRPLRSRLQVGLQPLDERAVGGDRLLVRGLELGEQRRVTARGVARPRRDRALEEAARAPGAAERDVGELLRRIADVGLRRGV
ncbi:MAG TPA: hypothetical protein VFD36_06365, partial [Kofleriaceae bacterium]|nr:hypothetical protein [Kofleriaceae bacterium]